MSAAGTIARAWLTGFEPAPDITVSQWSEQCRRLPETSSSRGARWRNDVAPYLTGIMDASLERGVKQIAVVKCAQAGVSEALLNVVLFHMSTRPCPVLMILPTVSVAASYSKERLADAIRSIPELHSMVSDKRLTTTAGLPESTLTLKLFAGGFLSVCGGNSPNSYARWSARVAIADDCDRIPAVIAQEGDAVQLLTNRVTSFPDGFTMWVSTPVLAGGRIETLFQQGDQRRYFLPCLGCGRWDHVTWSDESHWHVAFTDRSPSTAHLACPCGYLVGEPQRMDLVRNGQWRPTATPIAPGYTSFHVPATLNPFVSLSGLVTKFLSAHLSGARRLREFVTQQLAEGWRDPATAIDPSDLAARLEDF